MCQGISDEVWVTDALYNVRTKEGTRYQGENSPEQSHPLTSNRLVWSVSLVNGW
jgi:hypothetical protein